MVDRVGIPLLLSLPPFRNAGALRKEPFSDDESPFPQFRVRPRRNGDIRRRAVSAKKEQQGGGGGA